MLAAPAVAAPANLTGVQAWTSGSQTYIRVRPDASTPIVAKVVKHTPLYVWGKYNGWYRVQTHDDIFGWVRYELLNSKGFGKVKELSPAAVERAADRSAGITMWGTPDQLKSYYQQHGAKGAAKGLIEMGVPITTTRKPRTVQSAAKATPRQVAPRKVVSPPKYAPKPRVVTANVAPRVAVQTPVVRQVAPVTSDSAPTTLPALAPVRVLPPAPPKTVARTTTARTTANAAKPAKRLTAKEKKRQQLRAKMGMTAKTPPPTINKIAPVSPEDLMKARRAYLDARKKKLETTPDASTDENSENSEGGLGGPQATPSNFESNAHDKIAHDTLDLAGWAPFNASGWNAGSAPSFQTADWNARQAPKFRLITEEAEAATLGDEGLDEEELRRWNSLPALDSPDVPEVKIVASAQKKASTPSRGGSPRDRYRDAKGDFRQGMVNQALSYRGRPYVFGSASPSRGFDCSGLIYFMLRQRGYNPPRTAAGYRSYGTGVARNALKPGDLLLFANTYKRGISHIGIYIGNNNFVHAASTRQGVRTDSLATKYFANKYYGARRVPTK